MHSDKFSIRKRQLETKPGPSGRCGPASKKLCISLTQATKVTKRKARHRKRVKIPFSSINQLNELQTEVQAQLLAQDDDDGHLNFDVGDILEEYTLLGFIGRGTFGRVAKARHTESRQIVALKIVKNEVDSREGAKGEIGLLNKLKLIDPEGKNLWVEMLDFFEFQGHVCMAFEKLGDSLYSFMKENNFKPFLLTQIKHIAYQLCSSVKALHENGIMHTDLKPENICFVTSDFTYGIRATRQQTYRKPICTNIRIIDFGSAIYFHDRRDIDVQTRTYRAPEVLCGLSWDQRIDIWSIGCILFELYTGKSLFPAEEDYEQYLLFYQVLGLFPRHYEDTRLYKMLRRELDLGLKRKPRRKLLKKYMKLPAQNHQEFFNLIQRMLTPDPFSRITLEAALTHPFFRVTPDDEAFDG
ncbi:hypothetical protein TNIN_160961 [Trichonephila inaurata madagascariensis]|uniref:Protein kinase domain-containing protein n=1 Tax=Trichonephila inaurata madagascariensis TaxID=2747483 RepID=A0A8X7C3W3_9ARAC|nr:hypothetical protein TNIN_160961 [Trichonephila inaurata madagascariensis]